jgi:alpha-beta hydrolase superfamily lysophospholipase
MQSASRVVRFLAVLPGVALAALLVGGALAQENKKDKDKDKADTSKKIKFTTFDGVELAGTFYPKVSGGKDRDACVLFLHNFDRVRGGNSHQDGWDYLAEELQKDGYTVLSFDFRGFGDSKEVSKDKFWNRTKAPQNFTLQGASRAPDTIDFKEFHRSYYPNLANDVAAAKAALDHKNDSRELNSSNLILIGAGEGATVGSLWLASECKRRRSLGILNDRLDLDDAESRDVACALWLSISPTLAAMPVPVRTWLTDAGAENKIPNGFLYGDDDRDAKEISIRYAKSISDSAAMKRSKVELTGADGVPHTKLRGSQLLTKNLNTVQLIKLYLERVMEKRGAREARSHDPTKLTFYWSFRNGALLLAKSDQESLPRGLPLAQMGISSP